MKNKVSLTLELKGAKVNRYPQPIPHPGKITKPIKMAGAPIASTKSAKEIPTTWHMSDKRIIEQPA